uniref:Uncharacterized protein n=1 Tax=Myotis myotis TaxID=51298 RepID=A0A7J7V3J5_MYOMY|nr:hypothetical protein mMyoMyo1_008448 [Myotis myotis]
MRNRQESQLLSASSSVGETVNKHRIKCVITDIGKCYDSLREKIGETDKVCEGSAVREFSLRKSAAGTVWRESQAEVVQGRKSSVRSQSPGNTHCGWSRGERWTGDKDKLTKGSQSLGFVLNSAGILWRASGTWHTLTC